MTFYYVINERKYRIGVAASVIIIDYVESTFRVGEWKHLCIIPMPEDGSYARAAYDRIDQEENA